jgi:ankyrin repeat protein
MEPRLLKAVTTGDLGLLEQALGLRPSPAPAEQGNLNCLEGVTAAGSSALHVAAGRGHLELVVTICAQDPSLTRRRNHQGDTALICAARAGHADVVDHLAERALEEAAMWPTTSLRATNSAGETAMHEAVRNGRDHLVLEKLMSRDSGLARVVDGDGVSPLYLAVASNRADMVRVLIGDSPDGVRSSASFSGPDGQTALHAAVYVSRGNLKTFPLLAPYMHGLRAYKSWCAAFSDTPRFCKKKVIKFTIFIKQVLCFIPQMLEIYTKSLFVTVRSAI